MSAAKSGNRLRPIIRVFVSSTFSDMKHERNALHEHVFPNLEELCLQSGFQFQAIDLRWGVSTEAGLDHRALRICFDELRRAQEISPEPNFLILLGDRYGWRPLPEAISQAEFTALATAANTGGEKQTPLPGAHGRTAFQVLKDWYRCDENIVLPDPAETDPDRVHLNYILQPRTQNLDEGRDFKHRKDDPTKDTQDWLDVQEVLWRLINAAFPATARQWFREVNWPQYVADVNDWRHPRRAIPQISRFQASATEQEIWCGALSAANAENHVIACFREIANQDDFNAAEAKDFFDIVDAAFDTDSAQRQSDLKAAVELRLGENKPLAIPFSKLRRENGKVVVDASDADTRAFCDAVFERFRPIIESQIRQYWDRSENRSPARAARELKIEQDEHERFGRERGDRELFVGRDTELEAIRDYLGDCRNRWPLVVHGSSGCGKTALMWRAFEEIPLSQNPMIRLIGTTPRSSDLRSLLTNLCQQLRQRNPRTDSIPTEINGLRDEFSVHLQAATPEQPLVLFLDALDQLTDADHGRLLNWLPPGSLPAHMKLVVSCLSDRTTGDPAGQPYVEIRRRGIPAGNFISLDVLSEAEARVLLFDRWLPRAGRRVSGDQRLRIEERLASPACRQPIFLKLLFEEVRLWHSCDPALVPGESVSALLRQLFNRLSQPTNHGPLLVNRVLGYLSASRHGLAENEILEILFADPEYRAKLYEDTEQTRHELPGNTRRIPIALWSRLRFDLAPYLTERAAPGANVLTFYHQQVAKWVQADLPSSSDLRWQPHQRLADYFCTLADPDRNRSWTGTSPRPLLELPFHLIQAQSWTALTATLEDLFFLETKAARGLVFDLAGDFSDSAQHLPIDHPRRHIIRLLEEALRRDIHFIARHAADYPQGLFQCLWNSGWWYDCADAAPHYEPRKRTSRGPLPWEAKSPRLSTLLEAWRKAREKNAPDFVWLRSLRPPLIPLAAGQSLILNGHSRSVVSVAFAPDGRQIVSGSKDRTLRLWDLATGAELCCLHGHEDEVNSVAFSPDGRLIASGSSDRTVRVWDVSTGTEQLCLHGQHIVRGVAFSPDGRLIVSASEYEAVRLWDAFTGDELSRLQGDAGRVIGVAFSPDGRLIARGSQPNTVRLSDTCTGAQLCSFHDPGLYLTSIAFAPDGDHIVTGSAYASDQIGGIDTGAVHLWDTATGTEFRCLNKQERVVRCVTCSPDGGQIAGGSSDGTVRLWDTATGNELCCFHGHAWPVLCVAFSPDGRQIVSGSGDNTVRVWDVAASNAEPRRLREPDCDPRDEVLVLAFGPGLVVGRIRGNLRLLWSTDTGEYIPWGTSWYTTCVRDTYGMQFAPDADEVSGLPWRARACDLEAVIDDVSTGLPLGWFPMGRSFRSYKDGNPFLPVHPSGRIWADCAGKYLYLFTLEGRTNRQVPAPGTHGEATTEQGHNPPKRSFYCVMCGTILPGSDEDSPCGKCGHRLQPTDSTHWSCPQCEILIPGDWKFCLCCGVKCAAM